MLDLKIEPCLSSKLGPWWFSSPSCAKLLVVSSQYEAIGGAEAREQD